MTLKENLQDFLTDNPSELKVIYSAFPEEKETTIRGRLNENIGKCFRRIKKGVYLAISGNAQALIIEGDAWKEIKEIENCSIDAIICDSPYTSINQYYEERSKKHKKKLNFETRDIDKELLSEMKRVLKDGGHFFSFLPADNKDTLKPNNHFIQMALEIGFEFNRRWIWDKVSIGMGYNGRSRYEQIIFLSKGPKHKPYDLRIPDLLSYKKLTEGGWYKNKDKFHDAQKPNGLIRDIIKFCSKENDVILDPFAGSLVVAQECLNNKRNSVSIEISPEIIKTALEGRFKNG